LLDQSEAVEHDATVPAPYVLINMSELTAHPIHPSLRILHH
jgi:hypothetical protein